MACATLAAAEKGNETVGTYLMTELRLPSMLSALLYTVTLTGTSTSGFCCLKSGVVWCTLNLSPSHTHTRAHTDTADQSYSRWYKQQSG